MAEAVALGTTADAAAAVALGTSPGAAAGATAAAFDFVDVPPPVVGPGGGGWTKQVTCRYFMHGVCKEGDNCRYSHDLSTSQSAMVCRYYQRGCCAYGDLCRYEHTKPLIQEEVTDVNPDAKIYASMSSDFASLPETVEDIIAGIEDENLDLGAGNLDLGAGNLDLGAGNIDLGAGNIDLGAGNIDLGAGNIDLGAGNIDLGAGNIDLGAGNIDLGAENIDLGAGNIDLADENIDLAAAGVGAEDWVNAVEFVPGQPYCGRAAPSCAEASLEEMVIEEEYEKQEVDVEIKKELCPYAAVGECRYGENCVYIHGDVCDMCGLQVLHPIDAAQRSEHIKSCIEAHEKDMELSFAVQRSKDMVCGICMEVVYEKANPSERRFGILSNCSHTYCLKCIRKWRSAKQFESKIIKSCPECRITSNFVIPSEYWVEEKEEKQKLIQKYKEAMSNKPCRYFDEGRGSCPFGGNCFYKHAYPDGRREEPQRSKVGTSSRYRAQRRNRFWEFIEEQENGDPFETDEDEDEVVAFELGEMLLMLLAAGRDDELTDSEDEWDLFHDELEDYYDLDL
ncbi:E3 ubiquitin-protein ligase makorin-1 [Phaethornis superciliosus]